MHINDFLGRPTVVRWTKKSGEVRKEFLTPSLMPHKHIEVKKEHKNDSGK